MLKNALPHNLIKYRSIRRLSQTALAKEAGVSRRTIKLIENGQRSGVRQETILKLCHTLQVTPNELLGFHKKTHRILPFLDNTSVRDFRDGIVRRCSICERNLERGEQRHMPGECILYLHEEMHFTVGAIAARFDFSMFVIDAILADEHGRRAGKRRPPMIVSS